MSLVEKRGIHAMRIEDITERADVGKGVFYNYFDAKEALVAALVQEGVELLDRDYLSGLPSEPDMAQRIAALANAQESFYREHPDYALLFHQARGLLHLGGARGATLRGAFAAYLDRLGALLTRGHEHHSLNNSDLVDIAALMAGAAAGYRSFCIAAEREPGPATVGRALMGGIPQLFEERRRARPTDG